MQPVGHARKIQTLRIDIYNGEKKAMWDKALATAMKPCINILQIVWNLSE